MRGQGLTSWAHEVSCKWRGGVWSRQGRAAQRPQGEMDGLDAWGHLSTGGDARWPVRLPGTGHQDPGVGAAWAVGVSALGARWLLPPGNLLGGGEELKAPQ